MRSHTRPIANQHLQLRIADVMKVGNFPEIQKNLERSIHQFEADQKIDPWDFSSAPEVPYFYNIVEASDGTQTAHKISLIYTKPKLGGWRWWFACPVETCFERVAVLYYNGGYSCRKCSDIAYKSQNQGAYDQAIRRREQAQRAISTKDEYGRNRIAKPKGMHWKTYKKKLDALVEAKKAEDAHFLKKAKKILKDKMP